MSSTIIKNPSVDISSELLEELKEQVQEQGQVVVHCLMESKEPSYIRIWPTTFLLDKHSDHTSELVHAENISYYPHWTIFEGGKKYFSLFFTGLPKSCAKFDLLEFCSNQAGAFHIPNIPRNDSDVYYVRLK